ncbi:Protein OSB1 [Nymphaea thermarum]|nr:Protein OSB1 [Nymphaea thermarum]
MASLFGLAAPAISKIVHGRNHLPFSPMKSNFAVSLQFTVQRTNTLGLRYNFPKSSARYTTDFVQEERVVYPRPSEIPWQKELANSVSLIGVVGTPVQIKHLDSGKVLAWTRLAVKTSATETLWIGLTFWNELAYVAFQHMEKSQRIYVSGRLVSDVVNGDDDKPQAYYKVVVNQLNFIEKSSGSSSYESEKNSTNSGERRGTYSGTQTGTTQELWQAFFANPTEWWDNRSSKRNPKYPDFKHKDTGEALWIEGRNNPSWVKSQLAVLDSKMQSLQRDESNMQFLFSSSKNL